MNDQTQELTVVYWETRPGVYSAIHLIGEDNRTVCGRRLGSSVIFTQTEPTCRQCRRRAGVQDPPPLSRFNRAKIELF